MFTVPDGDQTFATAPDCPEREGDFLFPEYDGVRPQVVAAVVGVLLAGGLLRAGERITGIRARASGQRWKWAGVLDLMRRRDMTGYRKS